MQLQLLAETEPEFNMKLGEEACKSFKKIASTQLPQPEVKGAWLKQPASDQQLIFRNLSINLGNIMVKYAAFKKMEELYQSSFSESSFSESILQTSLAKKRSIAELIQQELYKNEGASASSTRTSFWQSRTKSLHSNFPETLLAA